MQPPTILGFTLKGSRQVKQVSPISQ